MSCPRPNGGTYAGKRPTLVIERGDGRNDGTAIEVRNLGPEALASLEARPDASDLLQLALRLKVIDAGAPVDEVPDVLGRYEVLKDSIRFIPCFPFEAAVRYRASFDPWPLGLQGFPRGLTLEFTLPRQRAVAPARVEHVFPSADSLPENLLRFTVCFSNSMERGWAEDGIRLLGPDGRSVPNVLYRPPVELWDAGMRHLTILVDPGRLKRRVGPNRELGPPLKLGEEYTLAVGQGMRDLSGRRLRETFSKSFRITEAVREPVLIDEWKVMPPAAGGLDPLSVMFPRPLDWALLRQLITISSKGGEPLDGRVNIEHRETRWCFTPAEPWAAGTHVLRVASTLEDVCGNTLDAAFDRPLRSDRDWAAESAKPMAVFHARSFVVEDARSGARSQARRYTQ